MCAARAPLRAHSCHAQRFGAVKRIGGGSFGELWRGVDTRTEDPVAIKFEYPSIRRPQLAHEAKVIKLLQGSRAFAAHHQPPAAQELVDAGRAVHFPRSTRFRVVARRGAQQLTQT